MQLKPQREINESEFWEINESVEPRDLHFIRVNAPIQPIIHEK